MIRKKKIAVILIIMTLSGLGLLFYRQMLARHHIAADDEIVLHIQLDLAEDIGLLVFDYCADGQEYSGGISNADRSLLKSKSDMILIWNKQELNSTSDTASLSIRFRIITEYTEPNFENRYPKEITSYINTPVSFQAHYGEEYFIGISGNRESGFRAVLM